MRAWFFGLQPRERMIAVGGVALAVAILLWAFLVRPLLDETAALRTSVETKQRLAVDVARIEGTQPSSVAANRQGADQPLYVIISNTAGTYGLGKPRTRNDGPNTIDVTLQSVSFDSITAWLVTLHDTYGVEVESASFSSAREPGIVNGQVSLSRL
jgi:general secretion pathway protein M